MKALFFGFVLVLLTVANVKADDNLCVYLGGAYRPIGKQAQEAVARAGTKSCSTKAEVYLYAKTKKRFTKLSKRNMDKVKYAELEQAYIERQAQALSK